VTTHQLLHRIRAGAPGYARRFPRMSLHELRGWLRELAANGYLVEVAPDDWRPTPKGSQWFAGFAEIDLEDRAA
jgi:hypothetical protein